MRIKASALFLLLAACAHYPHDVENALKLAGENRMELQKIISHYQATGDEEKLKAAFFLIGNMEDKYAIGGEDLKKYDPIFRFFQSLRQKKSITAKSGWLNYCLSSFTRFF